MNHVYSVSQVNSYIKNMFTNDYALNNIYIKGEVSNCKYHTSGHIYFTIKDETGQISCVMFASQRKGLTFRMQEGQSVVILGSISIYERDGKYQLYTREIILDGAGNLYRLFEELKIKLDEEGLFLAKYKKTIPKLPTKIGIVTAKTGAAIADIINIANRRNPYVQLILYPALVQGENASKTIVKGIKILDNMSLDTIIIGRGGGSIEDLWAFNEEIVARTVFECNTPIISAVGHETDTTIVDFVSDLRAPTPSAAAEIAVPDIEKILEHTENMKQNLHSIMEQKILYSRKRLEYFNMKLKYTSPNNRIRQKRQDLMGYEERLNTQMDKILTSKRHKLEIYMEKLIGLSPISKLNTGYSFVQTSDNVTIKSIKQVKTDDNITITVADGDIMAKVLSIESRKVGK